MPRAPGQLLMRVGTLGVTVALAAGLTGSLVGSDVLQSAVIAAPLFALFALVIGPAAAFAMHLRRDPGAVPRGLRVAAIRSGVVIFVLAAIYAYVALLESAWPASVVFALIALAGLRVALRARTPAVHEAEEPEPPVRAYTVPFLVGVLLFLGMAMWWWTALSLRGHSRDFAYRAAMLSDLRNLREVQRQSLADSGRYTVSPDLSYSSGVVPLELRRTTNGWTARVGHEAIGMECVIFEGSIATPPADSAGEPVCTGDAERRRRYRRTDASGLGLGLLLALLGVWAAHANGGEP